MKKLLLIMPLIMILVCISTAFAMPSDLMERLWNRPVYKQIRLEYDERITQFRLPPEMEDFSQGKFIQAHYSKTSDLLCLHYFFNVADYYVVLDEKSFEVVMLVCRFVVLNSSVSSYWLYRNGVPEPSTFAEMAKRLSSEGKGI